jgi:RimJ/RimL family protein N-acetyltransferase
VGRPARHLDPGRARGARTLIVRPSGADEAETHFTIQRDACVAAFAHVFPPERYPFPDAAVRERWLAFEGTVLLAERDGRAIGLAAFEACWLGGFYVVPDEWGSGVARELHDAALAAMPDCPELRLWTLEENDRARRFYEKRGWRLNGETRVVPFPPNPLDVGYSFIREEP